MDNLFYCNFIPVLTFVKMSSYQCQKCHCGDKTVIRLFYLCNEISYTGKTAFLYWISPQIATIFCTYQCSCPTDLKIDRHLGITLTSNHTILRLCDTLSLLHWLLNWAPLVSTAPTTSSFLTQHLASMDWARRDQQKHLSFGTGCDLY